MKPTYGGSEKQRHKAAARGLRAGKGLVGILLHHRALTWNGRNHYRKRTDKAVNTSQLPAASGQGRVRH